MNAEVLTPQEDTTAAGLLTVLPRILWERRLMIAVPAAIGLLLGIAAALLIKPSYQAQAMMLVESQDVPGQNQFAPADDEIDRRMAKIREQILSRPDLVTLIQTYDLYDASSHRQSLSTLVDKVRDNTSLSAVSGGITSGGGRNQASIAFSLTYSYSKPNLAQAVAQSFVDRLLKLDATTRVNEAQNSVNLLENQQETLQAQLSGIEGQLNKVAGANGLVLSAGTAMPSSATDNYPAQIAQLEQQNAQLRIQMGGSAIERDQSVVAAEAQLASARAQYSDNHPDVLLAQKRVDAARRTAASVQRNGVDASVQQQMASNNAMIGQMTSAMNASRGRAAQLAAAQARGPVIAQQVEQLQAQATQVRDDLGRVTSSLLNARAVAQMATEQRGQRLALIDPPVTPDTPTSPNRPLLIAGGLAAGLGAGLLLALALELLFRPVRGVGMLTGIVGVPPLSVVPELKHAKS